MIDMKLEMEVDKIDFDKIFGGQNYDEKRIRKI